MKRPTRPSKSASATDLRPPRASPASPSADAPRIAPPVPKYRQILHDLRESIETGRIKPGDKLPSEAELGQQYQASRITVARAVNELTQQGLVSRRAGSGTRVIAKPEPRGLVFGLLIPDLGRTEIFEPICQGMMRSPLARNHSLLWGHAMGETEQQEIDAEQLCQHYITQKVAGVFFAPLEFSAAREQVNHRIAAALERAGIPIVLLDRCYAPYPSRSAHDMVGIDNRAAGYLLTQHLIKVGAKRPVFVSRAHSASTVTARIAGFREALHAHGLCVNEDVAREGDTADPAFIQRVLKELRPDAILCANDLAAGRLIATLNALGIEVPRQMRVTGIDDVKYASLFPVPLTTQHQNCHEIGATAMKVMLDRVADPSLPVRDILLQTTTMVRASCGANLKLNKPRP
jgi:DNA-binding LacI/PurR family transcriptional regulator